jgi:hypothetical protein
MSNAFITHGGNQVHDVLPPDLGTDVANAAHVNTVMRPHVVGVVEYTVTIGGSIPSGLAENADGIDLNTPGMIALLSLDGIRNGPWVVQSGPWTRPPWYPTGSHAAGAFVYVDGGSGEAHQVWAAAIAFGADVVDTNSVTWVRTSAAQPTTYGDASHVGIFRYSADGRIVIAQSIAIAIDGTAVTSGTLPAGRLPGLTGDVTSPAGSTTTTVVNVAFAVVQTALAAATGDVSINGHKLTNVATPTAGADAANKSYVDARALGISVKGPALTLAASAVGTLSGLSTTVSGVALNTDGQRVVLTAEASFVNNGLWVVHAGAWTRPTDFAAGSDAAGSFVLITGGTFAGTTWACSANSGSDVVGTNNLPFQEFSVPGTVTSADGTVVVAGSALSRAAITGDVSIPAGSNAATLAASGVAAASYGDASHVVQVTFDTKGRATTATSVAIAIAGAAITSGTVAMARLPTITSMRIPIGAGAAGWVEDGRLTFDTSTGTFAAQAATIAGSLTVGNALTVTALATFNGHVDAHDGMTVDGGILSAAGTGTAFAVPNGNADMQHDAHVGGNLTVDGTVVGGAFQAGLNSFSASDFQVNSPATFHDNLAIHPVGGSLSCCANLFVTQSRLAFWASAGQTSQPTVSGSRSGGAALTNLLTVLAAYGLFINASSS